MWTPESLSEELETSYAVLGEHTLALAQVETLLHLASAELIRIQGWHRVNDDPETLGKNEAQRTAAIAEKCKGEATAVFHLDNQKIGLRYHIEAARSRIEHLRAQLRILELAAGIQRAA